jgi:hypothetical protein
MGRGSHKDNNNFSNYNNLHTKNRPPTYKIRYLDYVIEA